MRTSMRCAMTVAAVSIACLFSATARAEDSASAARTALSELQTWLGKGATGQGWTAFLALDGLAVELEKGDKADPVAIDATLARFNAGAPGIELARFQKLREALVALGDQLAAANIGDLPDAAAKAQDKFQPVSDDQLAAAKAALQAATAKLDKYLSGDNGAAWKKYLRWDKLQEQLKAESPDADVLKSVAQQFIADKPGLEMPVYANVGSAVENYANLIAARREETAAAFVEQIKGLVEELKQYAATPSEELAFALGNRVGWLDNARQAGVLVRAIRQRYSQPNFHARLSSRLVAAGIQQPVDETAPVRDSILGTSISGTGRTVGKLGVRLVPNPNKAELETMLTGTVSTRTVGVNGPATIHATGITDIAGRKRIVFDENGLASYPATATAKTRTRIDGVAAGRSGSGIVQRIATDRVYESKSQAEAIGAQHAAARVRQRVEKQAATQLGKAHWNYVNKMRNPLVRRREFPALLKLSTTDAELLMTALQANRHQLGAPTEAPKITVENDMAVQLHESMANNLAQALLGGLTLKEEDVQKQAIELLGELPEQLKSEEDRDPWSITFAKARPVTVKFTDGGFQVTVRGQRYTSGEREFQAMNVTADYKIAIDGNGSKAVRQGELQIVPPRFVAGQTRLSTKDVTLKTLLQRKFGKMFEPEIKSDGLVLPGKWREAGRLDLKQLQSGGGWLVAAWLESGEPAPPEAKEKVVQNAR